MGLSGAVTRRSVGYRLGSVETLGSRGKSSRGVRQRAAFALRPWAGENHRVYYSASVRCGSAVDGKRKIENKKAALVKDLSRDLAALYSTGFGIEGEESVAGEVREKTMRETVRLLMAELEHMKATEKEMKKRKKEEKAAMKAAMKAAKMRNCAKEDSSSSSSSESSDSECDEIVDMKQTKKTNVLLKEKPTSLAFLVQSPEFNQELSSTLLKTDENVEVIHHSLLKHDQGCTSSNSFSGPMFTSYSGTELLEFPEVPCSPVKADEKVEVIHAPLMLDQGHSCSNSFSLAAVATCSSAAVADAKPLDKIEVCMGGKCRKSGAMELLQEFERKVGIEGAVVGCKCMGKCKQGGPNAAKFWNQSC
ncbi:hypothetical protein HPP92_012765 [Vanilla planifolia]|uniref:Uncharacterized protein n=1 Tax=Vanilla planifolia TaxID=51239 RepID=A0A835QNP2_VANPL|nr:hypothetical protein HPP92_012765 [Vanilla planifolia]